MLLNEHPSGNATALTILRDTTLITVTLTVPDNNFDLARISVGITAIIIAMIPFVMKLAPAGPATPLILLEIGISVALLY